MKILFILTAIYGFACVPASAQTQAVKTDEEAIKTVITEETNAYIKRDSALLVSYYANDPITQTVWNEPNGSFGTVMGLKQISKNIGDAFRENPTAPYQPAFQRTDWFFRKMGNDWMWVNYKETIPMANGKTYSLYETRIMKRETDGWKIAVMLALSDHGIKK